MNPAGTLSNQIRSPVEKGAPSMAVMYNGGNGVFASERQDPTQVGGATRHSLSNGYITGPGTSSMSNTAFINTQDEAEERYVKGAF